MKLSKDESEALIELLRQAEELIGEQRNELDGLSYPQTTELSLMRTRAILKAKATEAFCVVDGCNRSAQHTMIEKDGKEVRMCGICARYNFNYLGAKYK